MGLIAITRHYKDLVQINDLFELREALHKKMKEIIFFSFNDNKVMGRKLQSLVIACNEIPYALHMLGMVCAEMNLIVKQKK